MEVCGTHTQAIMQHGISTVFNPKLRLLSGPGCPVCVTDEQDIDGIIDLIYKEDVLLVTFGDMMRVPGKEETFSHVKEKGKKVKIVYSPMEAIALAESYKEEKIVFLGIGFETTAPLIAATIKTAKQKNVQNLFFYIALKRMEPILRYILKDPKNKPHGIICPGHVAAIKGAQYFNFIVEEYEVPAVVCGFGAEDIVMGIYCLVKQIKKEYPLKLENLYRRCVRSEGNKYANDLLLEVFTYEDSEWRGIGIVPNSGFKLKNEYEEFDAVRAFSMAIKNKVEKTLCQCSDILLGRKWPNECPYFKNECTPLTPRGPCMVSREGACFNYYSYGGGV
jgi:hydrogenase expression/formation protein HypD